MIECKIEQDNALDITPELALQALEVARQYISQMADEQENIVRLPLLVGNTIISRLGEEITMHTYGTRQHAESVLARLQEMENDSQG